LKESLTTNYKDTDYSKIKEKAIQQGKLALQKGKKLEDNPYPKLNRMFIYWEQGFKEAQKEIQNLKENKKHFIWIDDEDIEKVIDLRDKYRLDIVIRHTKNSEGRKSYIDPIFFDNNSKVEKILKNNGIKFSSLKESKKSFAFKNYKNNVVKILEKIDTKKESLKHIDDIYEPYIKKAYSKNITPENCAEYIENHWYKD
jgi:hypothetical protein